MTIRIASAIQVEPVDATAPATPPHRMTLICDASWCPVTHVGGWAAWWKSNSVRGQASGQFRTRFTTSNHTEAAAIVNGMHHVAEHATHALIQTDSTNAISLLQYQPQEPQGDVALMLWTRFQNLLLASKTIVQFRHIKAHSGTDTPRTWVHDMLDKEARYQMRLARHASKKEAA